MNRRMFLKLTGTTTALAIAPFTFAGEEKPRQWIRYSDQKPAIGQKIILLQKNQTNHLHVVFVGEVRKGWARDPSVVEPFPRQIYLAIQVDLRVEYITPKERKILRCPSFPDKTKLYDVESQEWTRIKGYESRELIEKDYTTMQVFTEEYNRKENLFWMPVNESLPKQLPTFPEIKEMI